MQADEECHGCSRSRIQRNTLFARADSLEDLCASCLINVLTYYTSDEYIAYDAICFYLV